MANLTKTYYFPPNWNVHPGGPLKLGSVLSSAKRPLPPLLICPASDDAPQPATAPVASSEPAQPRIYRTTKHNFSYTTSTSYSGSASLFASFATAVLGVGPDASTKLSRDSAMTLRFARLDTQEWFPSDEELQKRVENPSVSRFLERLRVWSPKILFVITGVMVAYGARAETKAARDIEGDFKISLDPGMVGGMPGVVEFGPGLGLGKKESTEVGWETGADGKEDPGFVFAYKVQRIKVKKKNGGVINVDNEEYTRGALYEQHVPALEKREEYELDSTDTEENDMEGEGVLVEADEGEGSMWLVPV